MKSEVVNTQLELGRVPSDDEMRRLIAQAHQMRSDAIASIMQRLVVKLKNDFHALIDLLSPRRVTRHHYFKINGGRQGLPF